MTELIHGHEWQLTGKGERIIMARKRKKQFNFRAFFFILLAIISVALIAYFFYSSRTPSPKSVPPVKQDQQDDTKDKDKKKEADFRDAALVIQNEVTKVFKENNITSTDVTSVEKSVPRESGGKIEWSQKEQLSFYDRPLTVDSIKSKIAARIKDKNGIIYGQARDTYSGQSADRIDIAYVGELGGDKLTLVVKKVYLIAKKPKKLGSGKLAIIVDDCGYDTETVTKMAGLRQDISFAIIPSREYSVDALNIIRHSGKQAMLHLPMEPLDKAQMSEKKTVLVSMTDKEIKDFTKAAIEQLPGIDGVNNHQGSRATADERVMKAALSVIKSKKLFFVDSNTQPKTIAYKTAQNMGVKTAINRAFLDGQADVAYIKNRMRQAGEAAIKNGSYIAICHARPKTVIALTEMVDELEAMGVEFVFVSKLLR